MTFQPSLIEMRETGLAMDELLANGEMERAEQFMEKRQRYNDRRGDQSRVQPASP